MNLNETHQNSLQQSLTYFRSELSGMLTLLVYWALLIGILTCPVWLPILVERFPIH